MLLRLLANGSRKANLVRVARFRGAPVVFAAPDNDAGSSTPSPACLFDCGAVMLVLPTCARGLSRAANSHAINRKLVCASVSVPTNRRLFIIPSRTTIRLGAIPAARCSRQRQAERQCRSGNTRYTPAANRCARPIAAFIASATAQFAIALPDHRGTCRGFLPRGLSNPCPQADSRAASVLRDGQMSDKPKQKRTVANGCFGHRPCNSPYPVGTDCASSYQGGDLS